MKEVVIVIGGVSVIIDEDDLEAVSKWKWQYNPSNKSVERRHHISGRGKDRVRETWSLHRFIMGFPKQEVDHINCDRLDNRKQNLRLCTRSQNCANRTVGNETGYKGVAIKHNKRTADKYLSQAGAYGKHFYLGIFDRAEDAARAYDAFAKKTWGEFAKLNFEEEN